MIKEVLTIFVCQYIMIFLLGLQSLTVKDGRKIQAAIVSLCLGIMGWNTTGIVSSHYHDGMMSPIFLSFLFGGPAGIVTSIAFNNWLNEQRRK